MNLNTTKLTPKWEPIEPFERALSKKEDRRVLGVGEKEYDVCEQFVHIVDYNGYPPKLVTLTLEEIEILRKDPRAFRDLEIKYEKCFLWIIDESEKLKIAREKLRNVKRTNKEDFICHTNLSGARKAFIGGEMFFGDDSKVYINFYSDRYGGPHTPPDLWNDTKSIFINLGYTSIVDFEDL